MLKGIKPAIIALAIAHSGAAIATTAELPALNALADKTSISGLSSGAFMAAQFHVAYSKDLMGVGIVAGGPWNCAANNPYALPIVNATTTCMNPCELNEAFCPTMMFPNSNYLASLAKQAAKSERIDSTEHLKSDKVYIFSGKNDHTVATGVVDSTEKFYQVLGLKRDQILYDKTVDAGHAFITTNQADTQCKKTQEPFINNCDLPQAQKIFEHIYGSQNPPAATWTGELIEFDQSAFFNNELASMNKSAFVYVPTSCRTEQCKVHVAMHGCEQGMSEIGDIYVKGTGYLEAADTNNTIVLFPQVKKSSGPYPYNPKGCWDFWGYSVSMSPLLSWSQNYSTKNAPQMVAIKSMIDKLISRPVHLTKN
ncbi:poly(3-hydroxybutyrate) depolymerase [Vibrio profundum]|uniref:extracellular catalytic domain type 2 short-chain-length polyhydroxyalkanoate depolymerase n=1 Tax=Vibrio profundum TaxID=2910247 RepID=UPI003D128A70